MHSAFRISTMLLAFETSCDETSAAVVHHGNILSNIVSSQIKLHEEYGGVVPELAAREHLKNLLPVANTALREAKITPDQLDGVAVTQGPGLPGALLVGLNAAQAFAFALRRPLVGIHHHEAHLYSPWVRAEECRVSSVEGTVGTPIPPHPSTPDTRHLPLDIQPNVSLVVSGGHTMLVRVDALFKHRLLGSTLDDAAGECFDKSGKLLGLGYPAGPEIDRLAEHGNPKAFDFPRPMLNEPLDDFSFSGLKTSVRYFVRDRPELLKDAQAMHDLCASIQAAIVEVLVTKTIRAALREKVGCVTASGGVACNRSLRRELAAACAKNRLTLKIAEPKFCTDNAAIIAVLAESKLSQGLAATPLDTDIRPDWQLG